MEYIVYGEAYKEPDVVDAIEKFALVLYNGGVRQELTSITIGKSEFSRLLGKLGYSSLKKSFTMFTILGPVKIKQAKE